MTELPENGMRNKPKPHKKEFYLYNGLRFAHDPEDKCFTDARQQNLSDITKCLVVKNGDTPVTECQVVLEDLKYHFMSDWIVPPNGFEQKALRWAGKTGSQDGKREIGANRIETLEIVRLFRFPNPYFGISYFDGSHGKTHHFVGTYRLRLRIEAKISDRSGTLSLEPTTYEVHLTYSGALDLEIKEITRMSAA